MLMSAVHVMIKGLQLFAVCARVDLTRLKPKSCAHEYNYVVKPLFNLNRKPCTWLYSCAQLFSWFCKVNTNSCMSVGEQRRLATAYVTK